MNKHLTIHFFGCSFTALEQSPTGYKFKNFRKIIQEKLSCNCINHSETGKSNQHIFNDVYNESKKLKIDKDNLNHIFVIQTTFNDRLGMYSDISNAFVSMTKRENEDDFIDLIQINFYNDWLKYFYSKQTSLKEFKKQTEFLCSYLKINGIKFIVLGMDEQLDYINDEDFFENNNFMSFDKTYSFYKFIVLNKLRIVDDESTKANGISDFHFNKEAHQMIANNLIEKIKFC
jgi:hypothetical protein